MKLRELKIIEGLVDGAILGTLEQVTKTGITNGAQTVTLAKCFMALRDGKLSIANEVSGYLNSLFPNKELIDNIKSLSQQDAQKLASVIYRIFSDKNKQIAPYVGPFCSLEQFLLYATEASANE